MPGAEQCMELQIGYFVWEDASHPEYVPWSSADARDGEPYYIDPECSNCGEDLVLNDECRPSGDGSGSRVAPEVWDERDGIWWDEWVCPECEDGVHMDVPATAEVEHIRKQFGDFTPISDC